MGLDIEKLLKNGVIVRVDIDRDVINGLLASTEGLLVDAGQLHQLTL